MHARPIRTLGLAIALIAAITGTTSLATAGDAQEKPLTDFIRVVKRPGVGEVVEASIRVYSAPETKPMNPMGGLGGMMGRGKKIERPEIVLVSMVHLGEAEFFKAVAAELKKGDLVLYEEQGDGEMSAMSGKLVSQVTGLAFQGTDIKPDPKTWRSADLSQESLFRAMGMDPEQLKQMSKMMKGMGGISPEQLKNNPMLKQMLPSREQIIGQLRMGNSGLDQMQGDMAKFILYQRNAIVMSEMTKASYEAGKKRVYVIYGAAHMPGVEAYLTDILGYKHETTSWNDAVYADPKAAAKTAEAPTPAKPAKPGKKPGKRVIY